MILRVCFGVCHLTPKISRHSDGPVLVMFGSISSFLYEILTIKIIFGIIGTSLIFYDISWSIKITFGSSWLSPACNISLNGYCECSVAFSQRNNNSCKDCNKYKIKKTQTYSGDFTMQAKIHWYELLLHQTGVKLPGVRITSTRSVEMCSGIFPFFTLYKH